MKLFHRGCFTCCEILMVSIFLFACNTTQTDSDTIEKRINSILSEMSLEEKIGQTAQRGTSSRVKNGITDEIKEAVRQGKIGSFLNVMNKEDVDELQRIAIEESPHGIPLIFGRDVIHGFKTIFPIPLGLAATWNPLIVEQGSRISAVEASTYGIRWTFAPMLDIARDPRWGRIAESPGEDPYLASVMARAYIKGFQGDDLSSSTSIAACAKHFAAYGAAEGGRDYNTVIMSEQELRDVYLAPFQAAEEAGAATYMTSFNEINGVPSSGNGFLLKTVLRNEWGFDGFVVSDWNSVTEMIAHGYCTDEKDAARRAASAGLDMEMMSTSYEKYLKDLIDEGKFSVAQLDEMVRNILRVKFRLGLFDKPYMEHSHDEDMLSEQHLKAAKEGAIQSLVLLKNKDNVLPLSKSSNKIAVIGPLADAPHEQLGTWTFDGEAKDTQTPVSALRQYLGNEKVTFVPGMEFSRQTARNGFTEAIVAAKKADVVLFFGGEEAILSGEAHSRANINLPGAQEDLIMELAKTGKPVVLVIMAGRPLTLGNIINNADAILMAWHPGTMGGPAITDVLFGEASPGGRLPVTWPKSVGQIPIYYNHKNTGRPANEESFVQMDDIPVGAWQSSLGNTSHYLDLGFTPQFPFGYGLTYTSFDYKNIRLSKDSLAPGDSIEITAEITNTGNRAGTEIVQLYIRDLVGDITRPVRELKGFQRLLLQPGEKKMVNFILYPENLAFHNQAMERVTEPGKFKVWIGRNAMEGLESEFELVK